MYEWDKSVIYFHINLQPEKNVRKLTMNSVGQKKTTTSLVSKYTYSFPRKVYQKKYPFALWTAFSDSSHQLPNKKKKTVLTNLFLKGTCLAWTVSRIQHCIVLTENNTVMFCSSASVSERARTSKKQFKKKKTPTIGTSVYAANAL